MCVSVSAHVASDYLVERYGFSFKRNISWWFRSKTSPQSLACVEGDSVWGTVLSVDSSMEEPREGAAGAGSGAEEGSWSSSSVPSLLSLLPGCARLSSFLCCCPVYALVPANRG